MDLYIKNNISNIREFAIDIIMYGIGIVLAAIFMVTMLGAVLAWIILLVNIGMYNIGLLALLPIVIIPLSFYIYRYLKKMDVEDVVGDD